MGLLRPAWTAVLSLVAGGASIGCGGAADVRRAEPLDASWSVEDVAVRGPEVRVVGELDADPRARTIDVVNWCAQRPLGRGLWTGARLVWWFTADDVAAALECVDDFSLSARADATPVARPSSTVGVRIELLVDGDATDGIDGMTLRERPKNGVTPVFVSASEEGDLRLAVDGAVLMPAATEGRVARFDVPTNSLVSAALRRGSVRVFGAGRTGVARVQLYVANLLANEPDPPPDSSESSSEDE